MVKSKLPPQSSSSPEVVEPHPQKRDHKAFFLKKLFLKKLLQARAVLGYLPKLKRSLGLAFGAEFLHKNVSNSILYH